MDMSAESIYSALGEATHYSLALQRSQEDIR
jgi:hypothetical protein